MAYDYTKASDLVSWCKEQKNKANAYRLGGIGRYENGVRIFDCVGLIKCFIWHDYSCSASQITPDLHCTQMQTISATSGNRVKTTAGRHRT